MGNQTIETRSKIFILENCGNHLKMLQRTLGISSCKKQRQYIRLDTMYCATNMSGLLHMNAMHIEVYWSFSIVNSYFEDGP
jgi:hypothetical protein